MTTTAELPEAAYTDPREPVRPGDYLMPIVQQPAGTVALIRADGHRALATYVTRADIDSNVLRVVGYLDERRI